MSTLKEEFAYYLENQGELVKKYSGKFLAIKNKEVIGAYDTMSEAVNETSKSHEKGTFLVQKCEPGKNAYTATYRSRVAFSDATISS